MSSSATPRGRRTATSCIAQQSTLLSVLKKFEEKTSFVVLKNAEESRQGENRPCYAAGPAKRLSPLSDDAAPAADSGARKSLRLSLSRQRRALELQTQQRAKSEQGEDDDVIFVGDCSAAALVSRGPTDDQRPRVATSASPPATPRRRAETGECAEKQRDVSAGSISCTKTAPAGDAHVASGERCATEAEAQPVAGRSAATETAAAVATLSRVDDVAVEALVPLDLLDDGWTVSDLPGDGDGGPTPYYLENFRLIVSSVLGNELDARHFDQFDVAQVSKFSNLSEAAQKTYVRLFCRKYQWIVLHKIKYDHIAADMSSCLNELVEQGFAHDGGHTDNLREVLELLSAAQLKQLCKDLRQDLSSSTANGRTGMIDALLKHCRRQNIASMFGCSTSTYNLALKKARHMAGAFYKLAAAPREVFMRMLLLYSLTYETVSDRDQSRQQIMFEMLMVNNGSILYPKYQINRKTAIFADRESIIRLITVLHMENDIFVALERNRFDEGYKIYLLAKSMHSEWWSDEPRRRYDESLPPFLRRYTTMYALLRVLGYGVEVLQKMRNYSEAVDQLRVLLAQQTYGVYKRGYWWERLALNLEQHLKQPDQALEALERALEDPFVRIGYRLALYQRAMRICGNAKFKHRASVFYHEPVLSAPELLIQGCMLPKTSGPGLQRSIFISMDHGEGSNAADIEICSVEQLALAHYLQNGYNQGVHGESSTFTTVFGLLFWDVIFLDGIADAFYGPYQSQPTDFQTDLFYSNREAAIKSRLAVLKACTSQELADIAAEAWTAHKDERCSPVVWDRFEGVEHLKGLVRCLPADLVAAICERYCRWFRHCRSGMPDLTVWNTLDHTFKVIEVKGPGDRLSTKQILWLDYLQKHGAPVEVCYVEGTWSSSGSAGVLCRCSAKHAVVIQLCALPCLCVVGIGSKRVPTKRPQILRSVIAAPHAV